VADVPEDDVRSGKGGDVVSPRVDFLLTLLHQAYDHTTWHGPNLKSSLRGVKAQHAAWRPQPERHNVWELTVHAAYWKYRVLREVRKALGEDPGSFEIAGSDFFERPLTERSGSAEESDWKDDRALLERTHRALVEAAGRLDDEHLDGEVSSASAETLQDMILGVANHDVYHAGQIRLLRRMGQGAG
jgi:hypothetical protein